MPVNIFIQLVFINKLYFFYLSVFAELIRQIKLRTLSVSQYNSLIYIPRGPSIALSVIALAFITMSSLSIIFTRL